MGITTPAAMIVISSGLLTPLEGDESGGIELCRILRSVSRTNASRSKVIAALQPKWVWFPQPVASLALQPELTSALKLVKASIAESTPTRPVAARLLSFYRRDSMSFQN